MNQSLPLLTPLRGIAALMVVLFHARLLLFPQWMESIAGHTQLIENGYLWVDLFFILSGLVLAHVYGEAFARTPRTISYGRFLWLRLTRVYPLYLVTLLLLVGWELYKAHHGIGFYAGPLFKMWEWEGMPPFGSPFTPAEALPSSLLLLQVVTDHGLTWNFAAWSLSVEWISYLLFPLLIPLAVTRSRWSNLAPLLALTVLAFIVHSRGTLDVTSGALAIGRGVSEFVLGLWLLPKVKAARQWPMMQRDLPPARAIARARCCASWTTASPTGWGISPTPSTCSTPWCCSPAASLSTLWRRGSPRGGTPRPTPCWACWPPC
ncbi:acyltransferase [Aeromonas caviae]|uniref:acyltransferase family protein n=1 Tax=Aeromonas caviae TaxID=648 RepID=UPI000AFD14A4